MKKLLLATTLLLTVTACEQRSPSVDTSALKFTEVCYDSVVYLVGKQGIHKGFGFMSVKLDTEGNVEVCNKWEE